MSYFFEHPLILCPYILVLVYSPRGFASLPSACFLLKDDEPEDCRCGLCIAVLHSLRALAGRRGVFSFLQFLGRIRTGGRGMGCELILSGHFNVQLLR